LAADPLRSIVAALCRQRRARCATIRDGRRGYSRDRGRRKPV